MQSLINKDKYFTMYKHIVRATCFFANIDTKEKNQKKYEILNTDLQCVNVE